MSADLIIEIVGAVIGLTYLYLEYKAHIALWFVGVLMSLFYMYIFFHSGFYADFGVYTYYLIANLYGLWIWRRQRNAVAVTADSNDMRVSHCTLKQGAVLALLFALLWPILWRILSAFPTSASPVGDAFTTSLSIVAMWLMAHKRIEHWYCWLLVNVVSTILYVTKGLYPTAVMMSVYAIGSLLGYLNWRKMLVKE